MKKILFVISAILLVSCTGQKVKEINQYSIAQFYENINISFAAFSPDETSILVTSNETGIYNVFEINISDGTKRQITNSETESLFALNYVYGTNQILY